MTFYERRQKMVDIFQDTASWYLNDPKLTEAIYASQKNTILYFQEAILEQKSPRWENTSITVTKNRTLAAASQLHAVNPDLKIGVLNFASATNPGGGVLQGSFAQEESICRCSTLYPCLTTMELKNHYYGMHRLQKDYRYTDAVIYIPDVLVIKSDDDFPMRLPEESWFSVDILTCAAPNLRVHTFSGSAPKLISDQELYQIHCKRAKRILTIAAMHLIDVLILGAFGCGAFRNNPEIVAQAYRDTLSEFSGHFKCIEFAVFCSERDTENYSTFYRILTE